MPHKPSAPDYPRHAPNELKTYIVDYLHSMSEPVTVSMIERKTKASSNGIYRSLNVLHKEGIVSRSKTERAGKHWEWALCRAARTPVERIAADKAYAKNRKRKFRNAAHAAPPRAVRYRVDAAAFRILELLNTKSLPSTTAELKAGAKLSQSVTAATLHALWKDNRVFRSCRSGVDRWELIA